MKTFNKFINSFQRTILGLIIVLFSNFNCIGQTGMENFMRQSGKIYVVIVVIAIIFSGIIFYLIKLDKKIGDLENEIKK